MVSCELCGAETDQVLEHRAEEHGVQAVGIGEEGKTYYVQLLTAEQVKPSKSKSSRHKK